MLLLLMAYDEFKVFFEGGASIHKRVSVVASCFIFLFQAQPFDFMKCMLTYFHHFFSPTVCALFSIALFEKSPLDGDLY